MVKVLFVCHGNICRSVMAEYMFKEMTKGLDYYCESRAVSLEEIGNDIYPPVKKCLDKYHISYDRHYAKQITKKDYDEFDVIFVMDDSNLRLIKRIIPIDYDCKIRKLLDYDVADPWYTGDFDVTYKDIKKGIENYLSK